MKSFGNIAKDSQVRAVASGSLTNGASIIVNADGTVSSAALSAVSASTSGTKFDDADGNMGLSYDSANGKVVIAYKDQGDSNKGKAVVATVSGTSISFGTPAVFNAGATANVRVAYDVNAQKHVIIYQDTGNSQYGTAVVATVSGTSISFGSETVFESGTVTEFAIAYNSTAQKVVLFYRASSQTNDGTLRVGTVSGTSISFGTVNRFENGCENQSITYDSSNDKMVLAYRDGGNSDKGVVRVGTVSGTTISVGSEVEYESGDSLTNQIVYDETSGKIVIAYAEETNSNHGTAIAGTVSGTSVTFGSKAVFNAEETRYLGITYDASAGKPIIGFKDGEGTSTSAVPVELDGTTVSFGTTTSVDSSGERNRQQIVYNATSESNVIILQGSNEGFASVYKAASTNLTSENFVGFLDGKSESISESIGSATVFNTANSENIAAAYDSTNSKVVVFSKDGGSPDNLEAVVGTVSNGSISFGSAAEFHAGGGEYISAGFDSSNGKLVVAYKKTSDNYLYSKVGTVSGTDITFGSEAAVDTTGTIGGSTVTFDSTNNKIVVAYDAGSNGHAKVGTISGTDISYGSRATFESASVSELDSVFDTDNGKVVIAYKDEGNSNYGTAVIGTVSGTSISFGTPVVFESAVTKPSINYVGSSKVFIGFQTGSGAGGRDGKGIVGTVSGTSISFGSAVVFESNDVLNVSSVYHSDADKVVVFYEDINNSQNGEYVVGTISGTSLSFTTGAVFENAAVGFIASVYDSNDGRAVAFYRDEGDSNKGTSITYRPSFTKSTTVLDGVSTSIKTANSISRSQSGLTAGQTYFVQNDGTLSETAASPSVTAGTAISATELIVKG